MVAAMIHDEAEIERRMPVCVALSELWVGWRWIRLMPGLLGASLE